MPLVGIFFNSAKLKNIEAQVKIINIHNLIKIEGS